MIFRFAAAAKEIKMSFTLTAVVDLILGVHSCSLRPPT